MHGVGDHKCLRADLQVLGVQPQIRIAAFERALPEHSDLLIEGPAESRDAVLGHPGDPQLLDQAIDLPGRDPVHIRLEHDGDDRLLTAAPRFKEAREIRRALALAGNQQLDLPDPRLPGPWAIAVAVRDSLRAHLATLRADLDGDLRLHQLTGDQCDRLTNEITVLTAHHLGDDIGSGHPVLYGHRGAPSQSALW